MKLDIDFAPRSSGLMNVRRAVSALGTALAIAGTVALTSNTVATLPPPPGDILAGVNVDAVNAAIETLNMPWGIVLTHIEESVGDAVRLTRLEIDTASGRLMLQGEATDDRAVLALPALLNAKPDFSEARVLSQSRSAPSAQSAFPVRFVLELRLRSARKGGV